jgi:hypothetical protein
MTAPNSKSLMAEMLVRQVFTDTVRFEDACSERGVSLEEGISQALTQWLGPLQGTGASVAPAYPVVRALPDPADCPPGQESHFILLCEHDLRVLRVKQQRYYAAKDAAGVRQTAREIEGYLQTLDSLRARVA